MGVRKMSEIKIGDKVRCVACEKEFEITKETFILTLENEIVICPYCQKSADVFEYLLYTGDPKPVIESCDVGRFYGRWVLEVEFTVGGEKRHFVGWLT